MSVTTLKLKWLSYRFKNNIPVPASNLAEVNRNWLKWVSVKVWGFQKVVQNYLHLLHYYVVVWAIAGESLLAKMVLWNGSYYHRCTPGWEMVHRNHPCSHRHGFDTASQFNSSGTSCEPPGHGTSWGSSKDLSPVPLFPSNHQSGLVSGQVALACPKPWAAPWGFSLRSSWWLYPCTSAASFRSFIPGAATDVSDNIPCIPGLLLSQRDWEDHFLGTGVLWSDAFQEVIALLEVPSG